MSNLISDILGDDKKESVQKSIKIDKEVAEVLELISKKHHISFNKLVGNILSKTVSDYKKDDSLNTKKNNNLNTKSINKSNLIVIEKVITRSGIEYIKTKDEKDNLGFYRIEDDESLKPISRSTFSTQKSKLKSKKED